MLRYPVKWTSMDFLGVLRESQKTFRSHYCQEKLDSRYQNYRLIGVWLWVHACPLSCPWTWNNFGHDRISCFSWPIVQFGRLGHLWDRLPSFFSLLPGHLFHLLLSLRFLATLFLMTLACFHQQVPYLHIQDPALAIVDTYRLVSCGLKSVVTDSILFSCYPY